MIEDKIVDKGNVSIVERYKVIDVIKGYGICLMVCGHSGAPFTNWIYLFHMALFFIASGYLWNERNAVTKKNVVQYVKRKAKSLWLPFVLINLFFTVTQNFFLNRNLLYRCRCICFACNSIRYKCGNKKSFRQYHL